MANTVSGKINPEFLRASRAAGFEPRRHFLDKILLLENTLVFLGALQRLAPAGDDLKTGLRDVISNLALGCGITNRHRLQRTLRGREHA